MKLDGWWETRLDVDEKEWNREGKSPELRVSIVEQGGESINAFEGISRTGKIVGRFMHSTILSMYTYNVA